MAAEAKRGCGYRPTLAAYLAGLLDGDGCIMIRRREKVATFTDRRRGLSFIVLAAIGGEQGHLHALRVEAGGLGTTWVRKREGQRHLAEWKIAGGQARVFLGAIQPYLRLKKEQARVALGMPQPRSRWGATPVLRAEQERRFIEIKRLNHQFGRGKAVAHGAALERVYPGKWRRAVDVCPVAVNKTIDNEMDALATIAKIDLATGIEAGQP